MKASILPPLIGILALLTTGFPLAVSVAAPASSSASQPATSQPGEDELALARLAERVWEGYERRLDQDPTNNRLVIWSGRVFEAERRAAQAQGRGEAERQAFTAELSRLDTLLRRSQTRHEAGLTTLAAMDVLEGRRAQREAGLALLDSNQAAATTALERSRQFARQTIDHLQARAERGLGIDIDGRAAAQRDLLDAQVRLALLKSDRSALAAALREHDEALNRLLLRQKALEEAGRSLGERASLEAAQAWTQAQIAEAGGDRTAQAASVARWAASAAQACRNSIARMSGEAAEADAEVFDVLLDWADAGEALCALDGQRAAGLSVLREACDQAVDLRARFAARHQAGQTSSLSVAIAEYCVKRIELSLAGAGGRPPQATKRS